jgi:predicted membrane-bound spermidine synthase
LLFGVFLPTLAERALSTRENPMTETSTTTLSIRLWVIIFALFTTGFAAMVYEVILMREVAIVLGSTLFASSSILSVVMFGLFAGSWFFGRISNRRNSLALLITMEFAIAAISLIQILLIRSLGLIPLWPLKFMLSTLIVFPPTFFMGGEIPVAIQLVSPYYDRDKIGEISGKIYAADTFGGTLGALLTPFVFVYFFGSLKSAWIGGFLNVISGLLLLYYCYKKEA